MPKFLDPLLPLLFPERDDISVSRPSVRVVERERQRLRAIEERTGAPVSGSNDYLELLNAFEARRQQAQFEIERLSAKLERAPTSRTETDLTRAISRHFNLAQRVARLRVGVGYSSRLYRAGAAGPVPVRSPVQQVKPSGVDRREFRFGSVADDVRTVFGTIARFAASKSHPNGLRFISKLAFPCVQQQVRKEVMFANKKAGHGYRGPRRPYREIWC